MSSAVRTGGHRVPLSPAGTPVHASTVFCTQYAQKDWHQRLGSAVHADAIMDRIVHNTLWIETGTFNMREHTAVN